MKLILRTIKDVMMGCSYYIGTDKGAVSLHESLGNDPYLENIYDWSPSRSDDYGEYCYKILLFSYHFTLKNKYFILPVELDYDTSKTEIGTYEIVDKTPYLNLSLVGHENASLIPSYYIYYGSKALGEYRIFQNHGRIKYDQFMMNFADSLSKYKNLLVSNGMDISITKINSADDYPDYSGFPTGL